MACKGTTTREAFILQSSLVVSRLDQFRCLAAPGALRNLAPKGSHGRSIQLLFHPSLPRVRRQSHVATAVVGPPIDPLPDLEKVIVKVQNFKLRYGQQLALVGAWGALGAWDASKAVTLTWVEGDSWTKYISLPHGVNEVKLVITNEGGSPVWADGANLKFTVPVQEREWTAAFSFGQAKGVLCVSNLKDIVGRLLGQGSTEEEEKHRPSVPLTSKVKERFPVRTPQYPSGNGVVLRPSKSNGVAPPCIDTFLDSVKAEEGEDGTISIRFEGDGGPDAAALVQALLKKQQQQQQQ